MSINPIDGLVTLPAYYPDMEDNSTVTNDTTQSTKTAQDVINYVTRQFGDEAGVQIEEDDIQSWIDIAQSELAMDEDFSKRLVTRKLIVGYGEYKFPTKNILRTQSMHIDNKIVKYKSFQQFQEDMETEDDLERLGKPECWTEWGGTFKLFPIPDKDYELKVYALMAPEIITDPQTRLGVPDRLYPTLLKKVMYHAYMLDENIEAANFKEMSAENDIQKRREYTNMAAINTYPTITYLDEFSDTEGF